MTDFLEALASRDNTAKDDFIVDGIRHCAVCNEPKQAWIDWPNLDGAMEKHLVAVTCDCDRKREAEEEDRQAELRFQESLRHYQLAINGNLKNPRGRFENDDSNGSIYATCRNYVSKWEEIRKVNDGILFYGAKGTGKSFYAGAIVNALIEKRIPAVMTTTAKLMMSMSNWDNREDCLDAICHVPMLALDDLGAERDTSYSAEMMYNVVNERYEAQLPTIVTTNLDLREMRDETDIWRSRIYDRVIEMCPITIKMDGNSRRLGIAGEHKAQARELLRGES